MISATREFIDKLQEKNIHYTYYGYKIANSKISKLKAPDEKSADKIQKEIDFYSKYKDCLNKWLDFFRSDEKWKDMY